MQDLNIPSPDYQAGSKPQILGPGFLETAHTAEEQTSIAEVKMAARIYTALTLAYALTDQNAR